MITPDWSVRLTEKQRLYALEIACKRNAEAEERGYRMRSGLQRNQVYDSVGALGEMAASLVLGFAWDGTENPCDVGPYEIRSTAHRAGHLILSPRERHPDHPFVLVVGDNPFVLAGWMYAHEAQVKKYKRRKKTVQFWVPQSDLHPMVDLPEYE